MKISCLYRAEIYPQGNDYVRCFMYEYRVVKETRCGVRIEMYPGDKNPKFVNLEANKKWAWSTREEAMASLHRRKERQVAILKGQLERAEAALIALRNGIAPGVDMYVDGFEP